MLEVKCLTSVECFASIAGQWDQLLSQSLDNSYSLTWSWVSHWMEVFLEVGEQPLCIVVYDQGNLVGIGPFWIEHNRQFPFGSTKILRFLGSRAVCADHLDLIIHQKNSENICSAIWEQLYGPLKKKWDVWEYNNVSTDSSVLQFLRKLSDKDDRCLDFKINEYYVCPYINLPASWEAYIESLSRNQRRSLKVSSNAMSDAGNVIFRFCDTVQDLSLFMNTHIQLHRKSWNERGQSGSFGTEKFRRFHHEFAEEQLKAGSLFLCNIELDNIPVGSFYGVVHNRSLYSYLIGVNRSAVLKANVGRVLIARCIEECIRRGYTRFDFLRGFESYKYNWTDLEQRELLIMFYNRSAGALLLILKQFLGSFGRQIGHVIFKDNIRVFKKMFFK